MLLYSDVLHYLFTSLPVFQHSGGTAYKPGLHTISELDNFYGNPHRRYRTVHIAGTNGKGSVSHMLAAVLQGAGYKTGLFTSPHLIDFRERIRINGQMITESEVTEFVNQSRTEFNRVQPSFFEMTAAMAFDHFAKNSVDIAVIETGMGGRLDATNIIHPVLSVITNISMDHMQFLGNNIISIAAEKAGIIKQGVPVIIGETQQGAVQIFEDTAQKRNCTLIFADQQAKISRAYSTDQGQVMYIEQNGSELSTPAVIDLYGEYQQKNIITVLIAIQCLLHHTGIQIETETILSSLAHAAQTTGLCGRWQKICEKPLTICDTAHNPAGWKFVRHQIERCVYRTLHIILGFVNDKDISGMLELMPINAVYYFTKASIPRALDEADLMKRASEFRLKGSAYTSVADACKAALHNATDNDMIFIGGSTFIVAEALSINKEQNIFSDHH